MELWVSQREEEVLCFATSAIAKILFFPVNFGSADEGEAERVVIVGWDEELID